MLTPPDGNVFRRIKLVLFYRSQWSFLPNLFIWILISGFRGEYLYVSWAKLSRITAWYIIWVLLKHKYYALLSSHNVSSQGKNQTKSTHCAGTRTGFFSWWSTKSRLATLLSSLIARRWVGLQTLWRFQLKDLSIDEMVGAWCFGCCQTHRGLPVGFLLLRYSVLFTV